MIIAGYDLLTFQLRKPEQCWTKGDIFAKFRVSANSQYANCRQVMATYFILKVSSRTRAFVKLWIDLVADLQLLTDQKSVAKNLNCFRENRHDQSLFSMLVKDTFSLW